MPSKEEFEIASKCWNRLFGKVYIVESLDFYRKRQGIKYTVRHLADDSWQCSCKSFKFRVGLRTVQIKGENKIYRNTCKHIRFCIKLEGKSFRFVF